MTVSDRTDVGDGASRPCSLNRTTHSPIVTHPTRPQGTCSGTLPTRQREVATLFYVDDCSVAEIAAILDLTDGTVKYHLSHARDSLRKLLADDQDA